MEAQPLRTVPSPHSGKAVGPIKSRDDKTWKMMMKVKEEPSSPSINLGLGIGAAVGGSGEVKGQNRHVVIKHEEKQQPPVLLLTPDQSKELEQQSLVFKYIVAGLPVPLHLVHPIWKSVATSSEYANGAIYKQYTSFVGFSPLGFDYRTMMDPEPGRCRRTDGKKWRCGRDVVPSQKYCERHVHRGRQRSRKHVEAPKTASPHYTTPPTNNYHLEKSSTYQSSLVPTNLQLRTPISDNNCTSNAAATIPTNNHIEKKNNFSPKKESTTTYAITTPILTPTTIITSASASPTVAIAAAADDRNSSSSNVHNEGNTNTFVKHNTNVNRSSNNVDIVSNVSPVLGFSPKSVIQDCSSSWVGYRSRVVIDPELMRCRRTDGKKWQCRKDAVPDQKYCARHMHRGAKRHAGPSQPVVTIAAIDSRFSPTTKNYRTDDHHVNMNINLSIGIPANSQVVIKDEKSTTTSSSETISASSFINEHSSASHTWPPSP